MPTTRRPVSTPRRPVSTRISGGMALRDARLALGMSTVAFGRAVGLNGPDRNIQLRLSQWEKDLRPIPHYVSLLAECFLQGARPSSWPD